MAEQDPGQLADELDHQADQLEQHSGEVQKGIEDARQDWEHKRHDEGVPGAPPPQSESEEGPGGAEEDPPPEARREG